MNNCPVKSVYQLLFPYVTDLDGHVEAVMPSIPACSSGSLGACSVFRRVSEEATPSHLLISPFGFQIGGVLSTTQYLPCVTSAEQSRLYPLLIRSSASTSPSTESQKRPRNLRTSHPESESHMSSGIIGRSFQSRPAVLT